MRDPTFASASGSRHLGDSRRTANNETPPSTVRSDAAPSGASLAYLAPVPALAKNAPASRYADLSSGACKDEVKRRALPIDTKIKSKGGAAGVASPMRLVGPLHGVRFVTPGASSPFGVLDCRLVLALDDLAGTLAENHVVTVRIDNFYRAHAHLPGKKSASQHASGLAADVTSFSLEDGRTLSIDRDWHATIGDVSCGPDAVMTDPDDNSITLRNLDCDIARHGLFHHMLSPGFDAAHRTHLHFDIKPGQKTQSVR